MYNQIQDLKDELINERKISKICQDAISDLLIIAEVSRVYRIEGKKDGNKIAQNLSSQDKEYICRVLSGHGPYKKWSKYERVNEVNDHFYMKKNLNEWRLLTPKFKDLMDGAIILHEWVNHENNLTAEDRRGEMSWSYIEGCYEGIAEHYCENKKENI